MFPYSCRPPIPRPEPFSPLPWRGAGPDWGKWIRDRLAEKGALLAFPSVSAFPAAGAAPSLYLAEDTGVLYRWDGAGYAVLVDPSSDVKTYSGRSAFPDTGRSDTIYIDASTNLLYRWDETGYVLLTSDLSDVESRLAEVESKIPAQATAQNQLADKDFVNSSIATNTATFRGTYNLSTDLSLTPSATDEQVASAIATKLASLVPPVIPENNDYCFVQVPYNETPVDPDHIERIDRYKCTVVKNGTTETRTWGYEFSLNNSSFTAEQWAAISSGITSGLVAKLGALPTAEALAQALAGKQDRLTFETSVTRNSDNPVKSSGIWAAIWGALSALPTGFSSLYDWVKSCFASPVVIAPEFDASGTYAVGDVCIDTGAAGVSGLLYRCKKGYTVTGEDSYPSSDPEHWEEIDVNTLLAGKASKADATLTPIYSGTPTFSEWTISPSGKFTEVLWANEDEEYKWWFSFDEYPLDTDNRDPDATSVSAEDFDGTIYIATRTRTDILGYRLGSQSDKPIASEAEAEALRTAVAGKMPSTATGANIPVDATQGAQKIAAVLAEKLDKSGGTVTGALDLKGQNVEVRVGPESGVDDQRARLFPDELQLTNGNINDLKLAHYSYNRIALQNGENTVTLIFPFANGTLALLSDIYAAVQQIAPAWVSGTAYTASEHVTYNGVVYRCKSAYTATASSPKPDSDTTHWEAKRVSELFLPLAGGTLTGTLSAPRVDITRDGYSTWSIELDGNIGNFHIKAPPLEGLFGSVDLILPRRTNNISGTVALISDIPDVSGYAAKAHNPTAGNLAALDANGNPTDSGVKPSDKFDATSAAPAFSTSSTYSVGDHVTYNGALYRCTTAVATAGAWTGDTNWTADTMTDPDAVLDVTAQNQLRVVAKDGTLLWAQGYDLASTSSATLACDAVNNFTFADGATTQAFALPTAPTGKVGDFGLDIDNSANTGAATLTLTGLDTTFSVVVPEGESLTDMLAIAAGELARFYVTLTTFRVNNLPTWHIVKQVVEDGGAQS